MGSTIPPWSVHDGVIAGSLVITLTALGSAAYFDPREKARFVIDFE